MHSGMRLVTFNIQHARAADGSVDLDLFRRAVRELDPDILALQEVDRDQPRSHGADLTAVAAEEMGAVAHRFAAALSGTPGATWVAATGREQPGTASYGIALLSRYPADGWQVMRLPRVRAPFPFWLPRRRPQIIREEPRAALVAQLETPLGRLCVANTHLSFVPGWNRVQLRRLLRDLAVLPDPLVLVGDLNMTPRDPAQLPGYRHVASALTYPADAPAAQLDHVLARGDLPAAVRAVSTPELALSDHRPLVVDLAGPR
jgi:endonuclease/exonuclease/phosphatase family metal-dependent hydrolase